MRGWHDPAMGGSDATRLSLIQRAAQGAPEDREEFAVTYGRVVRAYLLARWRASSMLSEVDDAVQEVLLTCLREGGALERFDPNRGGGFRPFLYGVVRNVALHAERARARRQVREAHGADVEQLAEDGPGLSTAFDRAWAEAMVREAAAHHRDLAVGRGPDAERRVELLRLRHSDGVPIREIAVRWGEDASRLHHQYALARREFREALREVVAFHHPGTAEEVEERCQRIAGSLR